MEISFDPFRSAERSLVQDLLDLLQDHSDPTALAAAGIGTDAGNEDTRSAASVFGAAPPLSAVQLGAGATPLDNAPAGLPGSSLPMQTGLPGLVSAGLPLGAQQASAPAGNPAGGVELDAEGIPWHHEIHASTKTKTKAGIWTKLRGLNDEAKYNRIKAELKALHAMPAAGGTPLAPSGPANTPIAGPSAGMTPGVGTAGLPSSLPPLQPLQPAANAVPQNFDEMMPRITAGIAAGILPQDTLAQACAARQLPGVVALVSRPDFVPHIWGDIKAAYPALA